MKEINHLRRLTKVFSIFIFNFFLFSFYSIGQVGTVVNHQKISELEGNFTGQLDNNDAFNRVARIGDLDDDGITDIAVGAFWDDDGGNDRGAVWILFLNSNSTIKSFQKISDIEGNFSGVLFNEDAFGYSVTGIGDLDGDQVEDIAVGAPFSDFGGASAGSIWMLFLNTNGTVKDYQMICYNQGNFNGVLSAGDFFGIGLGNVGDLNNDGINDIAGGASGDSDGGGDRTGAVWILFLNTDGTVLSHQKISATQGGFSGGINSYDRFGRSISSLKDLDNDGTEDIIVGAITDDEGGIEKGALWVLFLNPDATVKNYQKISDTYGNFQAIIDPDDNLGQASSALGDIDGDGVIDVAVSAHNDDDGGQNRGAIYILFLNHDGTVKTHQKISDLEGNFTGILDNEDTFGSEISFLGDLNNDGNIELGVGACWDDDGGTNKGAVWILTIESNLTPQIRVDLKAFLEGPYTGTIMSPLLNLLNYLPLSQPYSTPPWNYTGTEAVSAIPSVNVVDWVLVELRETSGSASTAVADSMVARKAGFVLTDGTITNITGTGPLSFSHEVTADLYAVVYHRNHIPVMSSGPLVLNGTTYSWDFTTGAGQAYGGALAHKHLGNGVHGLASGDGDGNGTVNNADKLGVWVPQTGQSGYLAGDFDMNGEVQNQDKNDLWKPNSGMGSQVP